MVDALTEAQEREASVKLAFAEALLRFPSDPFKAAMTVTYGDTVAALLILQNWQNTPEINRLKAKLIEERGEEAFLPTKAAMLNDVLARAYNTSDNDEYAKLMAMVFDVRGMTSKSAPSVVVNNTTNNKTMSIPFMVNINGQALSDEEYEKALMEQQQKLVNTNGK